MQLVVNDIGTNERGNDAVVRLHLGGNFPQCKLFRIRCHRCVCHITPLADVVGDAKGQVVRHFDLQGYDLKRRCDRTDRIERLLAGYTRSSQGFAKRETQLGFNGRVDDIRVAETMAAGVGVAFQQEAERRLGGRVDLTNSVGREAYFPAGLIFAASLVTLQDSQLNLISLMQR